MFCVELLGHCPTLFPLNFAEGLRSTAKCAFYVGNLFCDRHRGWLAAHSPTDEGFE